MATRKEKNKTEKTPRKEKDHSIPKLAPVHIHFKIETIKNFQYFHKLSSEFSLELSHCNKIIKSTNPDGGKFYLCSCPNDDLILEEGSDVIELNLHYILTIHPDDISQILSLADCPLFIILNLFTEKVEDFGETEEEVNETDEDTTSEKSLKKSAPAKFAKSKKLTEHKVPIKEENKGNQKGKKKKSKGDIPDKAQKEVETEAIEKKKEHNKVRKIPIGFGHFDLAQIIISKPLNSHVELYLYPEFVYPNIKTPKITMHMYSVLGVLQNTKVRFCNIASITLESVFNFPDYMKKNSNHVHVDFSVISSEDLTNKHKLFTFGNGRLAEFGTQDRRKTWRGHPNVNGLGTFTSKISSNNIRGIYVENIDLLLKIEKHDPVFVFDSLHRILLTEEDTLNLEHLINYKFVQLMVEISIGEKQEHRYVAFADLSPFLYPDVVAGRFCATFKEFKIDEKDEGYMITTKPELLTTTARRPLKKTSSPLPGDFIPTTVVKQKSVKEIKKKEKKSKHKKSENTEQLSNSALPNELQMFAIFGIGFYKPITERSSSHDCDVGKLTSPTCFCEESPPIREDKLAKMAQKEFEDEVITIVKQLPTYIKDIVILTDDGMRINCNIFKEMSCFFELRDNLMERITKFVAAKYNVQNPTKSNQEFKDLMVIVFNELTVRIEEIINDYFAGTDNYIEVEKVNEFKDIRIFTAKEARELSFIGVMERIWTNIQDDAEEEEDVFVDLILKELEVLNFTDAETLLIKLLEIFPTNYYGMLVQLYFTYLENSKITEIWLNDLMKLTKAHPNQTESWALLYVVFARFNYRAGYMHAKMNYELNNPPEKHQHFWDRKEMYYNVIQTENPLCYSVYVFMKMGLYKFAELILHACQNEFEQYQQHYISCALLYLQEQYMELKNYLNNIPSGEKYKMLVKLFVGHVKYKQNTAKFKAIKDYEIVYHSSAPEDYNHVAFLRCGYWDIDNKNYEEAKTYFSTCCKMSNSFLAWYGMGTCCFRTGQYNEAEMCFSKATNLYSKMAELWIYLAIINLKKRRYSKAQDCCEIARRVIRA